MSNSTWYRDRHKAVCAILTKEEHQRLSDLASQQGRKVSRHAVEVLREYLKQAPSITPEQ